MKWRIESRGRFYDPDESTVVYFDTHSGDTHLLSAFAAFVLQKFDDKPLSAEELVNQISPSIESDDISDLTAVLPGVLQELVALDILQQE